MARAIPCGGVGQAGEVQIGLVDAHVLQDGGELAQNCLDFCRDAGVFPVVHRQKDGLGAEPIGGPQGHRRMDAVVARLMGGGGHDTPRKRIAPATDHPGLARKLGAPAHFHRSKKGIHVQCEQPHHLPQEGGQVGRLAGSDQIAVHTRAEVMENKPSLTPLIFLN